MLSEVQIVTCCSGKNRPLDEDDMDFVNNLADAEAAKETSIRQAERQELDAFQQVSTLHSMARDHQTSQVDSY